MSLWVDCPFVLRYMDISGLNGNYLKYFAEKIAVIYNYMRNIGTLNHTDFTDFCEKLQCQ